MADNKNKVGEFYTRPIKLGKWEGFKQFLWNGETSQFLGRTAGSWGKCLKHNILEQSKKNPYFEKENV